MGVKETPVTGTCQNLEKSFLRQNKGKAKAEEVRPEPVLIPALDRMVARIAEGEKDRLYIWSQLKAIRQDLEVQGIYTATAVRCEEMLARVSLQHADQQEFRKCIGALRKLYAGLPGCNAEFGAYQLLVYACAEQQNQGLALVQVMYQLSAHGVWGAPEVVHAQKVLRAVKMGNYAGFWKLYAAAPNCSRLVMDFGVERLRFDCIKMMTQTYKTVQSDICMNLLGFGQPLLEELGGGELLPGCMSAVCVGAASVNASGLGAQADKCARCIEQHHGVVAREGDGKFVFDARGSVGKIVVPPSEKQSAKAVGNTHLDVCAFVRRKY